MHAIDRQLLSETKSDIFDDSHPANVLTQARQKFLKLCAALTEQGFSESEKMTVAAFNTATEYLTAKHERK
jgi:hypothetical protein